MALADILAAIAAQADRDIAEIEKKTVREKEACKHQTDQELTLFEKELKKKTEAEIKRISRIVDTEILMERRKTLLREKQAAIDGVYREALEKVQHMPSSKLQKREDALKSFMKRKGKVEKSQEGGFLFRGEHTEEDYTFPPLMQSALRPMTELTVISKLFT